MFVFVAPTRLTNVVPEVMVGSAALLAVPVCGTRSKAVFEEEDSSRTSVDIWKKRKSATSLAWPGTIRLAVRLA